MGTGVGKDPNWPFCVDVTPCCGALNVGRGVGGLLVVGGGRWRLDDDLLAGVGLLEYGEEYVTSPNSPCCFGITPCRGLGGLGIDAQGRGPDEPAGVGV